MIVVFGGTFNPPTKAHKEIAEKIKSLFKPTKIIVLPTGDSYTWKKDFVDFSLRQEMLKLVFKEKIYQVSSLENKENYEGTYQSLLQIKELYQEDVYFLLGADNLLYINKWVDYEKIIKEFKLIVVKRDNILIEKYINNNFPSQKDNFTIVNCNLPLSSSHFRSNPKTKADLLDKKVYEYILKHNLYGVNNDV
ncbi:MAG: nicotinate (nicotinamide) nucleotide adenylyltransferase [Acholeplasmataceae bacterium]|nr:nicotinate (nicotinamide) nucleotide adenylyltransferase [Acholeplasmataceae bacterium]